MATQVFEVIQDLEATSSKLSKEKILQDNKDMVGLKEFFLAALDPFETYYIKKIPYYKSSDRPTISFMEGLVRLKQFTSRSLTGGAAIEELTKILENMHPTDANLIERIIQKDPACGVQTQVNKIWPKLIREYPVLLCSAYDEKLIAKLNWKAGVIVNLKSDGARCNIVISDVGVELFSRQGRPIDVKGRFDYLFDLGLRNIVIDGELLVMDSSGKPMSRKEGNGIINRSIKGTAVQEECNRIYLMAWDCIPLEDFKNEVSNIPYITRFENLKSYVDGNGVHLIPADIVYSFDAAMEICQKYYDAGEEGAILKDKNMAWSSKRAKNAIKLKLELDCDLEVIGYQEGTGKLEGQMGALICQSRDKILKVSVGGGYSFKQRAQIAANYHNKDVSYITIKDGVETINIAKPTGEAVIGQILATLYNAKIECDGQWSLFLPRALNGEFRLDKSVADSFGEIK